MAQICSCDGQIQNLGKPSCLEGLDAALYPIFFSTLKQDGSKNCVDASGTLNQATFDGLFKSEIAANRWLPLTGIKNYAAEPADATTDEFEDGTFELLEDGAVSVTFIVPCADPYKLKAKIDALRCLSMSFMLVDRSGNLIGEAAGTDLCGRKIQDKSISTKVLPKNDSQTNKLEVSFVIDKVSNDRKVDFIEAGDIAGYDLTTVLGLLDVNTASLTANSTTNATWVATLDWGGLSSRTPAGGLTATEIEVYNETTSSAVPVTVIESPIGTYDLTFAAQTVTDVIHVRGLGGQTIQLSYDLKDAPSVTATI